MSDEELDRDWKPSGRRPQSTIARSFSLELMDIFRIENSVADLDEQIDKRKQYVHNQASELEALETRIREMEAMLKNQQPGSGRRAASGGSGPSGSGSGSGAANNLPSPTSPRHARPPLTGVFTDSNAAAAAADAQSATPRPLEHRQRQQQQQQQQQQDAQKYGGSRPGTARTSQQAVPGALPPTPVGSEDGDTERY